jgi:hypothetical protein
MAASGIGTPADMEGFRQFQMQNIGARNANEMQRGIIRTSNYFAVRAGRYLFSGSAGPGI